MQDILERCYEAATGCGDHPDCVPWKLADVQRIIHAHEEPPYYGQSDSFAVVELNNGRFGTVTEWADTTGHG